MPIENERKFVVSSNIVHHLDPYERYDIKQAYLPTSPEFTCRLRESHTKEVKRVFTLKTLNPDGTNTEVEIPLGKDDFDALWLKCESHLHKTRYLINHESGIWELDVFWDGLKNESFFWMAEIELPVGQVAPSSIPNIISDHLRYEVPLTDGRFSSRKLSNVAYARKIKETIYMEKLK